MLFVNPFLKYTFLLGYPIEFKIFKVIVLIMTKNYKSLIVIYPVGLKLYAICFLDQNIILKFYSIKSLNILV